MQKLKALWSQIPEQKRAGGAEELVDLLFEKVKKVNKEYVKYVLAFRRAGGGGADLRTDFQAVAKELVDQHREISSAASATTRTATR